MVQFSRIVQGIRVKGSGMGARCGPWVDIVLKQLSHVALIVNEEEHNVVSECLFFFQFQYHIL